MEPEGSLEYVPEGKKGSFFYVIGKKCIAVLFYRMKDEVTMFILHTEVETSLRGQGIGKKILTSIVSFVRSKKLSVLPQCSFASAVIGMNEDWPDALT